MQHSKITLRQYQILVILFTVGTTILITPSGIAAEVGQDAWLAPLGAMGLGLLLVLLYNGISRAAPGMAMTDLCEAVFGVWLGKALSLLFVAFSFFAASTVFYDVGKFIVTVIMPETPMLFVNILFGVLLVYAIGSGFGTFARMIELLFPWFVVLFLVMVLLLLPEIDIRNVQPLLEAKPGKLLWSVCMIASLSYMPLAVFLVFQPFELRAPEKAPGALFKAVLIGGTLSSAIVALTIFVLGANVTSLQEYPVYTLAQKVSIGKFIERIEAIVAGMWLITTFVKVSIYFYSGMSGLLRIAGRTSYRAILLPLVLLLVLISVRIFPNSASENRFNETGWIVSALLVWVAFPLVLLIGVKLKSFFKN
ncbi:endospore germination permease [Paenibacillus thiaminolyticus]|uniref:GerAB/ArcD/ProY family transporter n=1 Tax=Paenibacillus thiaminolyticus TaxID=49283 RepID=UPI003D2BB4AF